MIPENEMFPHLNTYLLTRRAKQDASQSQDRSYAEVVEFYKALTHEGVHDLAASISVLILPEGISLLYHRNIETAKAYIQQILPQQPKGGIILSIMTACCRADFVNVHTTSSEPYILN